MPGKKKKPIIYNRNKCAHFIYSFYMVKETFKAFTPGNCWMDFCVMRQQLCSDDLSKYVIKNTFLCGKLKKTAYFSKKLYTEAECLGFIP